MLRALIKEQVNLMGEAEIGNNIFKFDTELGQDKLGKGCNKVSLPKGINFL